MGGRLTLVRFVLVGIPVYWFSFVKVPQYILNLIRTKMFHFLGAGSRKEHTYHLVSWERPTLPKSLGGWDIKKMRSFNMDICMKSMWCGIFNDGIWSRVFKSKYLKGKYVIVV